MNQALANPPVPEETSDSQPPQTNTQDKPGENSQSNIDLIMKIPVCVQVILGTTKMPVAKLLKLGPDAVIPLDRHVGDPIDVVVNGRTVARGEVVLMEDDSSRFGISLTEIIRPQAGN